MRSGVWNPISLGFSRCERPSTAILGAFLLSSLPPCVPSRFRGPVRNRPPRSGLPRFSHHKRVFFRLRSAGFECFHRIHRVHYLFLFFYLLLSTCIRVSGLWQRDEGKVSGLWQRDEGKVSGLWQRDLLDPRQKVENFGAECSCLGQQNGRPLSAREQPELPGRH